MDFRRTFRIGSCAVLLCVGPSISGSAIAKDMNCSDFRTQPEAQAYFDDNGGSRSNNFDFLDNDGDGIACESLPVSGSSPETARTSEAGVPLIPSTMGIVAASAAAYGVYRWNRSQNRPVTPVPSIPPPAHVSSADVAQKHESELNSLPGGGAGVNVTINNVVDQQPSVVQKPTVLTSPPIPSKKRFTVEEFKAMPYDQYLQTAYWQTVRRNAIARAGGVCSKCYRGNRVLDVHHLSYDHIGREQDEFLVVLCRDCHRKCHNLPASPKPSLRMSGSNYQA